MYVSINLVQPVLGLEFSFATLSLKLQHPKLFTTLTDKQYAIPPVCNIPNGSPDGIHNSVCVFLEICGAHRFLTDVQSVVEFVSIYRV